MKIIKTSSYVKLSEFSPNELVDIGYNLMELGNYDENTGGALAGEESSIPGYNDIIETDNIVSLGRYFYGNQGNVSMEDISFDEIHGAIRELQGMLSANPTLIQPFGDEEIRNIKILISQLYKISEGITIV